MKNVADGNNRRKEKVKKQSRFSVNTISEICEILGTSSILRE